MRECKAALVTVLLLAGCGQGGDAPVVRLPGGETLRLALDPAGSGLAGSSLWSGRVEGDPTSSAVLVRQGGQVWGEVAGAAGEFHLHGVDAGPLLAQPVAAEGRCGGAVPGPAGATGPRPRLGSVTSHSSTVDVLVCYNAGTLSALGSAANVTGRAQALVTFANTVYANSQIDLTLRPVGCEPVEYTQASQSDVESEDLSAMKFGPEFAGVRARRSELGVDLYLLLLSLQPSGPFTSGIAYLPSLATGLRSDLCYSVVSLNGGGGTFTHELGHNFGCGHDQGASSPPLPPSEALYPFGYGFRKSGVWGTIMAYRQSGETRIPYFSNPVVFHQGDPTGSSSADNAQAMRLSAATVASYAQAVVQPSPSPQPTPVASPGGPVVVGLRPGWNALGLERQRITEVASPQVAGLASFDGTGYLTGAVSVANLNEGQGTRRGLWLFATATTQLTYLGEADGQGNFVDLKAGWNLVGFVSSVPVAGSSLRASQNGQPMSLGSAVLPQFTEIGSDNTYRSVDVQAGGQLLPGRAYFVFAAQAVRLAWD